MALRRVWIYSPNFTDGNNDRRLLVLHTSEGAQTYESLGNFFANPSSQVSSHVGIDDKRGSIGEYVKRGNSAWTSAGANMVAIQAEFCTPSGAAANWTDSIWRNQHGNMLLNAADWLAEENKATGIPLVKLTPAQAQGNGRGVCQHKDLGAWGGGHVDCGPGFPIDYVISLAKGGTPSEPETGADDMAGVTAVVNPINKNQEIWEVNSKGDLYHHVVRANGNVDSAIKRGTGYYGVPWSGIDGRGFLTIFALRQNGCDQWALNPASGGWTKVSV